MRSALALLITLGMLVLAPLAQAAETFTYQLLPGKSTLRYGKLAQTGNVELFASVAGTFEFVRHDDGSIVATAFNVTIEGPIYDGQLAIPVSAPFAVGDQLADYLAVDFANVAGVSFHPLFLNGEPDPIASAVIGPQASQSEGVTYLGTSYYTISTLGTNPSIWNFEAAAISSLGGVFQIMPATELVYPSYPTGNGGGNLGDDVAIPLLRLIPNVARIPEPASALLLLIAGLGTLRNVPRRR